MRKIISVFLFLIITIGLIACTQSQSVDEPRKVVDDFFTYLQAGNLEEVSSLCTGDDADLGSLSVMAESFKIYNNGSAYGEVYEKESKEFIKTVFNKLIRSYEVETITKDGDNYIATIQMKMGDLSTIQLNTTQIQKIQNDYQREHEKELKELYKTKGQDAVLVKIYNDIAPELFKTMKKELDNVKVKDVTTTMTLTEVNNEWKISKLD